MAGAKILVVEDDADIRRSLEVLLDRAGHTAVWAGDGAEAIRAFDAAAPDLVLLDMGLPQVDGWDVLRHIRRVSRVPVMVVTARGLETDKVRGLRDGADDYLTKPYGNDELLARVAGLLRRAPPPEQVHRTYDDGRVWVDPASRSVRVEGRLVVLTATEFKLLWELVRHAGKVLSRGQLLALVWDDPEGIGPGRVRFAVLGLRRKLGWTDSRDCPVETVRGFGYRYVPPS